MKPSNTDAGSSSSAAAAAAAAARHHDDHNHHQTPLSGPRRSSTDPITNNTATAGGLASHSAQGKLKSSSTQQQQHHELETIQSRVPMTVESRRGSGYGQLEVIAESSGPTVFDRVREHAEGVSEKITWMRQDQKSNRLRRRRKRGLTWEEKVKQQASEAFQRYIIRGLLRRTPLAPSKDGRHVPLNNYDNSQLIDERSGKPYINNFIRSSRYTMYDFLPKQLIFQFSKLGNFYFLVMGILQTIPGLSTVGRWTTIAPLSVFVAFSMAKEGFDDYRRYQLDKSENRSVTSVLVDCVQGDRAKSALKSLAADSTDSHSHSRSDSRFDNDEVALDVLGSGGSAAAAESKTKDDGTWISLQWQHLRVGDIVRLHRDQAIPADIVLLHATGPNGIAYIETMALDGETNLKAKQACPPLSERCNTLDGIRKTQATIISEDPNIHLYSYDGRATVNGETVPLSLNNVVYRGSILRNTTEAIGMVINSGEECKIRMNAQKDIAAKKPAMQRPINKMILIQIFLVVMLAIGLLIGYLGWSHALERHSFYIVHKPVYNASVSLKSIFFGYLIMFNTLIPLSLYISLEIVKLGQLYLLQDPEMYDPVTDTPMVANTTTILENLGQVSYVFSDKTGTLTENLMRFRKLSVAGVACLHDMDVLRDEKDKQKRIDTIKAGKQPIAAHNEYSNKDSILEPGMAPGRASTGSSTFWKSSVRPNETPEMKTEDLLQYIQKKPHTVFARKAKHFLLCIALCHTCLPETKADGSIDFQAASPDELALVEAAQDLGFLLIDRPAQSIQLQTRDSEGSLQIETYQVLDVIEFSSKRKRMSIILRMPDGSICVICKGADNVITSRLKLSHLAEQKVRDVERRSSIRKTSEQHKAIQRMSAHISAFSTPRTSFNLPRRNDTTISTGGGITNTITGITDNVHGGVGGTGTGRRSADNTHTNRLSQSEGVVSWLQRRRTEEFAAASTTPRTSIDIMTANTHTNANTNANNNRMSTIEAISHHIDENLAANEAAIFEKCFQHVDDFATEGLRTLLYAYRYIDEDTYIKWKIKYREAETSLVDRQERIEEAGDLIEQKFDLAGATAIEDKLQDGVPDTIDKLCRANVRVWMLTGDKRETAINIGHSAHVCKSFSETYILDTAAPTDLGDTLKVTLNDVSRGMAPHTVLVVDGQTLAVIDDNEEWSILFYDLVIRVDSVICCRASPSQKANLVKAIRRYVPKSMTLAIGDGANDIGMIQASHVGIGISGREGLQAARISDYSIAQFRFLQKLMFVHGRWNYLRTGKYVLATFWKEIFFYLVQAHYQRKTGYTGTSLYESWSLTLFNTAFTSLPVIILGIFEQDLRADTLLAVPELYTFGQKNLGFNFAQYFGWAAMGIAESFIVFYFTEAVYLMTLSTQDTSLYAMGSICFTVGVVFINVKLLILEMHTKTLIGLVGFVLSVGGWFLWCIILSLVYDRKAAIYIVREAFLHNFGKQLIWWTTALLILVTPIILELVVQGVRRVYWPTDQDLMQRIEQDEEARKMLKDYGKDEETAPEHEETRKEENREETSASGVSRSVRASWDGYKPPAFTPPAEETGDPMETLRKKLEKLSGEKEKEKDNA